MKIINYQLSIIVIGARQAVEAARQLLRTAVTRFGALALLHKQTPSGWTNFSTSIKQVSHM